MKPNVYRNPGSGTPARSGADPTDPEAIVRVVLEKSPLLVYIANLEYKIVLANRALREATGYDTGDCPNVDAIIEHFYPHGDAYAQRVRDIHDGWRRNEHIMGSKLLVQCKDGSQKTVAWYTSRLRIGKSPTIGYIAMGLDVTTQGTLEQWVGLLQRTLQHLAEGVVLTDANGSILAWNAGAAGLLGHTEGQMQGQPLNSLFLRGEREIVARSIDEAVGGERAKFQAELELSRAGGGTEVLTFVQTRLDGEGGAPLARLTVLSPSGTDQDEAAARADDLEAQLRASVASKALLESEVTSLLSRVSDLDAALATGEAAAGQIADLRGQLDLAEEAASDALTRVAALEASLEGERAAHATDLEERARELAEARDKAEKASSEARDLQTRLADLEKQLAAAQKEGATAAADAAKARAAAAKKAEKEAAAAAKKAEETLAAAQKEADETLAAAQKAAVEALAAANEEAEAVTKKADEAVAEATRGLESARKEAADAAGRIAELEEQLSAGREELARAKTRLEDLEGISKDGGAQLDDLRAKLADSEAALDTAEENWDKERARLTESHRSQMEALSQKAGKDRKTLEEQLHKDILAAEERSEVELAKITENFANEKKDLEQAAEIAQAEIESAAQQTVQEFKTKLDQMPSLEDHLGTVVELAVVSADTSGKVLAWSAGARGLDGRDASAAVGKVIHEDVLQLEGVAWKTLFGTIMIKGGIQQEVTLITASGGRRQVELRASLVKNAQGAPIGITEVLRLPDVEGGLELHAAAALGRLVRPVQEMLDVRTLAGLAAADEAARAARGLVRLAETVVEGASLADIESVARAEDLVTSLDTAEASLNAQGLTWREMRMTLQDLEQIQEGVTGKRISWRWNELIERCLHATGAERAVRQYGETGSFAGSGEAVVPLLLSLFGDASDHGSGLTIATDQQGNKLTVSVVGGTWSPDERRLAGWLAGEASGEVLFTGAIAKASIPAGTLTRPGSSPTLLSYNAAQLAEVGKIAETDKTSRTEVLSVEAEAMDDDEELDLELDEGPTGPAGGDFGLDMSGVSEPIAAGAAEDEDEELPSDHPVLASGSLDLMEAGDGEDLMFMAGEDSVIKSADVIYMAIRSLDDGDPVLGNGDGVIARKGEEADIGGNEDAPITQSELAPLLALQEIAEGSAERGPPAQATEFAAEMTQTDAGDGPMGAKPEPPKRRKKAATTKGRGRKRKRAPRKK